MTLYYTFEKVESYNFNTKQFKQEYLLTVPGLSTCQVDYSSFYSILTMVEQECEFLGEFEKRIETDYQSIHQSVRKFKKKG